MPRNNSMKGGKFLARGTYGCVYGPNLPGAKHAREDKYISKIVEKSDFQQEFNEVKAIGIPTIDPEAKFTIYPLDADTITDFDLANENNFKDCKIIDAYYKNVEKEPKDKILVHLNNKLVNIIQPNGGQSLDKFLASKFKESSAAKAKGMIGYDPKLLSKDLFDTILVKMINAFKSVLLFNVNGICHRDIKTPNLTVEPTFRLIDFGLSTKEVDLSKDDHQSYTNSSYPVWPLDYDVLPKGVSEFYKIKDLDDTGLLKYSKDLYDKIMKSYIENFSISSIGKVLEAQIPVELVYFLKEYISAIKTNNRIAINNIYKQSVLSIDTHSLGLVLTDITMYLERGIRVLFSMSSSDYKEYKALLDRINSIGVRMLNGNPLKRISIKDATEQYILALSISSIITKEQLTKEIMDVETIVNTKVAPVENVVVKSELPKPAIVSKATTPKPKTPTPKPATVIARVSSVKPAIVKVPTPKEANKIQQCYDKYTMGQLKDILSKNKVEGRSKLSNKTAACEVLVKLGLV